MQDNVSMGCQHLHELRICAAPSHSAMTVTSKCSGHVTTSERVRQAMCTAANLMYVWQLDDYLSMDVAIIPPLVVATHVSCMR